MCINRELSRRAVASFTARGRGTGHCCNDESENPDRWGANGQIAAGADELLVNAHGGTAKSVTKRSSSHGSCSQRSSTRARGPPMPRATVGGVKAPLRSQIYHPWRLCCRQAQRASNPRTWNRKHGWADESFRRWPGWQPRSRPRVLAQLRNAASGRAPAAGRPDPPEGTVMEPTNRLWHHKARGERWWRVVHAHATAWTYAACVFQVWISWKTPRAGPNGSRRSDIFRRVRAALQGARAPTPAFRTRAGAADDVHGRMRCARTDRELRRLRQGKHHPSAQLQTWPGVGFTSAPDRRGRHARRVARIQPCLRNRTFGKRFRVQNLAALDRRQRGGRRGMGNAATMRSRGPRPMDMLRTLAKTTFAGATR